MQKRKYAFRDAVSPNGLCMYDMMLRCREGVRFQFDCGLSLVDQGWRFFHVALDRPYRLSDLVAEVGRKRSRIEGFAPVMGCLTPP